MADGEQQKEGKVVQNPNNNQTALSLFLDRVSQAV